VQEYSEIFWTPKAK